MVLSGLAASQTSVALAGVRYASSCLHSSCGPLVVVQVLFVCFWSRRNPTCIGQQQKCKTLHVPVAVTTQNDLAWNRIPLLYKRSQWYIYISCFSYQGKQNSVLMHGYYGHWYRARVILKVGCGQNLCICSGGGGGVVVRRSNSSLY